jgi:hypothetical protein
MASGATAWRENPVLALAWGIWWLSEKLSPSYWLGKLTGHDPDSGFYGFYVLTWLAALLLILGLAPASGNWALALGWLALYRLQDLLFGTIGDAFQFRKFDGSGTGKVVLAIVNIVQIVTIFSIAYLIFTPAHAFRPMAPPSRFGHFYLSWSSLPPLGSGFAAQTLRARVLVMIESASGLLVTVIALGRFLSINGDSSAPPKEIAPSQPPPMGTAGRIGAALTIVAGLLTFLAGLAAVLGQHFYPALPGYAYRLSVHSWGWILLALGPLLVVAGACVVLGMNGAQPSAVGLAVLTAIAGFMFLPYTLTWGVLIVALSVVAICGLLLASHPRPGPG